ncbi:calcium-independent phospholipase a2-gamma, partial [Nannochloropsis oceanica]
MTIGAEGEAVSEEELLMRGPPPPSIGPLTRADFTQEQLETESAARDAAEVVASFLGAKEGSQKEQQQQQQQQQQSDGPGPIGWLWNVVTSPFSSNTPSTSVPPLPASSPPPPPPSLPLSTATVHAAPSVFIDDDGVPLTRGEDENWPTTTTTTTTTRSSRSSSGSSSGSSSSSSEEELGLASSTSRLEKEEGGRVGRGG